MKVVWRKIDDGSWQFWSPGYAVFGRIAISKERIGLFWWQAAIMCRYQKKFSDNGIIGYAPTLEGAKRIVETLCKETKTLEENGCEFEYGSEEEREEVITLKITRKGNKTLSVDVIGDEK